MKGPLVDIAATLFLLATVLLGGYLYLGWKKSQIEEARWNKVQKEFKVDGKSLKHLEKSFESSVKTTNLEE